MKCVFVRSSGVPCDGTVKVRRLTAREANNIDGDDWRAYDRCSKCGANGAFYLPGMSEENRAAVLKEAP